MALDFPKDQLIEMLVSKKLLNFLLKESVVKKGDLICYGKLLGLNKEDLRVYFIKHGYPGLRIPRNKMRKGPSGDEGQTEWTFNNGLYQVWYSERNTSHYTFSTESQEVFEAYWIDKNLGQWEELLNNEWVL